MLTKQALTLGGGMHEVRLRLKPVVPVCTPMQFYCAALPAVLALSKCSRHRNLSTLMQPNPRLGLEGAGGWSRGGGCGDKGDTLCWLHRLSLYAVT